MKINLKDVLKPTLILFAICVVVAAALGGTNLLTEDRIAEQQALKAEESRLLVLPEAEAFEEKTLMEQYGGVTYYEGYVTKGEDRLVMGFVFETSAKGYGGDVRVMTGIDYGGTITGVVILDHDETPGLGANAEKEDFRNQYKQAAPKGGFDLVKYQTPGEGQVEAMTGASITSKAVTDAVNQAVEEFRQVRIWYDKLAVS